MRNQSTCRCVRKKAPLPGIAAIAAASVFLGLLLYPAGASSIVIPPAAEKKTVSMSHSRLAAEHFFIGNCGKCHKLPDPATPMTPKSDCTSGIPELGVGMVLDYLASVRAGKELYESHCGRCHDLITPESHTPDYWSKNLCTSEECFVKKLREDEEQQLLLYLSSHARKN